MRGSAEGEKVREVKSIVILYSHDEEQVREIIERDLIGTPVAHLHQSSSILNIVCIFHTVQALRSF